MLWGLYCSTNSLILSVLVSPLIKSREYALFLLFSQETLYWIFNMCFRMNGREDERWVETMVFMILVFKP